MNKQITILDRLKFIFFYLANIYSIGSSTFLINRKSNYEKELYEKLKENKHDIKRIERVKNISPEDFYKNYYLKLKPVVIEGLFDSWPALNKWDFDFFKRKYGEVDFEVNSMNLKEENQTVKNMKLREIVDSFSDKDISNYVVFNPILDNFPELNDDLDLSVIRKYARVKERKKIWIKMFFGPGNTKTDIHMAPASNLFVQVHGEKKWVMFKPRESPFLYPHSWIPKGLPFFFTYYEFKKDKNDEKYPLANSLEGFETTLKKGDVLFVPPLYWHWVTSKTPSISLSSWWYHPILGFKSSMFFMSLCIPALFRVFRKKYDVNKYDVERKELMKHHKAIPYKES